MLQGGHAARITQMDSLYARRVAQAMRATSHRSHFSRRPPARETARQLAAEKITRLSQVARPRPSNEGWRHISLDAHSGRRCVAKVGWTGAVAPVQRTEWRQLRPSRSEKLRVPPLYSQHFWDPTESRWRHVGACRPARAHGHSSPVDRRHRLAAGQIVRPYIVLALVGRLLNRPTLPIANIAQHTLFSMSRESLQE